MKRTPVYSTRAETRRQSVSGDSVSSAPHKSAKVPQVLVWGLQIHFSQEVKLQIQNLQPRINYSSQPE